MIDFAKTTSAARTFVELESAVRKGLGKTGLMRFMELDHGAVIRKATGRDTPPMVRLIIGVQSASGSNFAARMTSRRNFANVPDRSS